ncbi:helix-turn-helix transcriptional regulator [Reichenbachiella agarivorans]|uniref:Helix-turn-helix transcriptional regulator n=1 Tax=Reichenbachiella agarivorans TaxID=2979464 RepID=A0ABY6CK58_9BACT|nr:helix-turn-helix domain-containing protein [Reichenbachiella agarivorans]UXP30906.1 helix-turn-helix transcriptional regulator [Reichenbachiella agarivorans]
MSTENANDKSVEGKEKRHGACLGIIQPVQDALYVLSGKWKLPIIISLTFGNKRFSEMAKEIPKITDRMLSKELRELEMNQLIKRTVYDSIPVIVEYSLTDHGKSLSPVIDVLYQWGKEHRQKII